MEPRFSASQEEIPKRYYCKKLQTMKSRQYRETALYAILNLLYHRILHFKQDLRETNVLKITFANKASSGTLKILGLSNKNT
jgi:hypothetical protein